MKTFPPKTQVDFVVVGAGAAGGVMAKELASAGFDVVVLEQGPHHRARDFRHDELTLRPSYEPASLRPSNLRDHHYPGRPTLLNDHALQPNTFRKAPEEEAAIAPAVRYGRCVGGGSVHFTGNYWRFHETDFVERSRWGPIAGTGFSDWPITYADLEPYYTKAERDLGISGLAGASPFDPPRSKPYPVPPLPVKSSGVLFERGARKLGWHAFPAPLAILSEAYQNRSKCVHCGFCEGFGCEMGAKSSTLATVLPVAVETGRCEIRAECYVRKIEIDRTGRVTGVVYFDSHKHQHAQKAKAVVVCANGAETPRLLLLSKSRMFPQGLANSSGLVGRFLMFASTTQVQGLFERPLNEFKSVQVTRVVHDFYDADPRRGFYGGGGLDARFGYYPITFALRGLPPDAPRWGPAYKGMLRDYFTRTMTVAAHATALPVERNSITLDPQVKDAWGLPALRVTYQDHPDNLRTLEFLQQRSKELLEAAGAQRTWARTIRERTTSQHLMGTCRMGHDREHSVVDSEHRAHDVPNLFIVDGSSFVTSGRNQPTCTIQALAYRAADRLIEAAKTREIRPAS
jgi:choline dehydrogenase-like flavoprotein